MWRNVKTAALCLLNTGWLLPLFFSVDCLLAWCAHEQLGTHGRHTFPFLQAAWDAFVVAGVWIGMIVLAARISLRRPAQRQA